jgi:hypothetical protein
MMQSAPERAAAPVLHNDWRGEIPMGTRIHRNFIGMPDDEPTELSIWRRGRPIVAHAMTADAHVRLLQKAERLDGYEGSYMCPNGPALSGIFCRYPRNEIVTWAKKRITDKDVTHVRTVFVDFDVKNRERVSGISATDSELAATWAPANECRRWLERELGAESIAFGCSGNGHFVLIAIEPIEPSDETTKRIHKFLEVMGKRFAAPGVDVDLTVAHPGRLMPCPGTLKGKGLNLPERPHRRTTMTCQPNVVRVPLSEVC